MITLFSDLDNTLIFSHRKEYNEEKILVEYIDGKEQSYISAKLAQFLKECSNISLIPITTRSCEQYKRIFVLPDMLHEQHALTCNGGVLLIDGVVDEEWLTDSNQLSQDQSIEVQKILKKVREDSKAKKIKVLQNFMFYFTCDEVDEYYSEIKGNANLENVYIGKDSRKIYVIASIINKGVSVERYIHRFGIKNYFTAGDSEFDVSMLNLNTIAIASADLTGRLNNENVLYSECEWLFQDINKLIKCVIEEKDD